MKEWTLEERYRVLESPEDIRDLHERIKKSVYRQKYHVQPVTGLSSDPNGFTKYKDTWHLFYQWCPWGAVHGLKYWYHVTSKDLVRWENAGVGLKPDRDYDNKGCHSGSAISTDEALYFFYTGNHRDENWVRTPYTCAAYLGEDGSPVKLPEPLFGPRDDYSEHQRDPKVIYVPEKRMYYIFIGAQTLDKKGCVQVYRSGELLSGWTFAGQLNVPGYEDFGGMWECPCIGRIGDKDVLLFSPQYTKLPGRSESTNHNVYIIGRMDYDTLTFIPDGEYQHLDFGFDFYAAQLASNVDDPDREIIIGWIGLPDNHYPTEPEEWEGSMSLPRELRIRDGILYQTPLLEMRTLRDGILYTDVPEYDEKTDACADGTISENASDALELPAFGEMELLFDGKDAAFSLFAREDGSGGLTFSYDAEERICTIDRSGMDKRFNEKVGEVLTMPLRTPLKKLQIFIDRSSVELFANDGEETFTTHLYPTERERWFRTAGEIGTTVWQLKASVEDNFVV
ncbi:MAG: sucrose-6-phosphate hydrolase [Lachnospiraceae bacterium]|nr:sucrose-6-phosphate hydrolase [Lachnospiraceae bacterium]